MKKIKLTGRPSHLDPIEVGEVIELIPMNDNKGDQTGKNWKLSWLSD